MINKVNRPSFLSLVPQSKAAENDPGSSQGSGMFYDGSHQEAKKDQKEDTKNGPQNEVSLTSLSIVARVEQPGMTEVVKDLLENKKDAAPASPGLTTTRYSSDSATVKGLLLNRKVE